MCERDQPTLTVSNFSPFAHPKGCSAVTRGVHPCLYDRTSSCWGIKTLTTPFGDFFFLLQAVANSSALALKAHEGLTHQFDFVIERWKKAIGAGTHIILGMEQTHTAHIYYWCYCLWYSALGSYLNYLDFTFYPTNLCVLFVGMDVILV